MIHEQQLAKLPKWAQSHIADLQRQRDTAVRALNEYANTQTKSPFYFDDYLCTGEKAGPVSVRKYIQAHKIGVEACGVVVDIYVRDDPHDKSIDIQWGASSRHSMDEVAMIPASFQKVRLVAKQNMRR